MILAEREPTLPVVIERVRTRALTCLRVTHGLFEFDTAQELAAYLDEGLDQLERAGYPRGLSRVILFYKQRRSLEVATARLHTTGRLISIQAPGCWKIFAHRMKELEKLALQWEPEWLPEQLRSLQ